MTSEICSVTLVLSLEGKEHLSSSQLTALSEVFQKTSVKCQVQFSPLTTGDQENSQSADSADTGC